MELATKISKSGVSKFWHFGGLTIIYVGILVSGLLNSVIYGSQEEEVLTPEQVERITEAIAKSDCPDIIKRRYLTLDGFGSETLRSDVQVSLKGSIIYGYTLDQNGNPQNPIPISCASASTLQKLVVRIIMMLFSLVGLIFAFSFGKSTFLIITSMGDPEKLKKAVTGLINPVIYTIALIFSYTVIVFILVGVLGFGVVKEGGRNEYNLFCQQRIIFNLAFDQSEPCK